jgi:hypothetical protein
MDWWRGEGVRRGEEDEVASWKKPSSMERERGIAAVLGRSGRLVGGVGEVEVLSSRMRRQLRGRRRVVARGAAKGGKQKS